MSVFYCDYHQRLEDKDLVGFNATDKPVIQFVCDDAVTEVEFLTELDEEEFFNSLPELDNK